MKDRVTMKPQPQTKNSRQLRNAERGRSSLPQGRAHQLFIQHQMVSPEDMYIQVTYRLIRWYLYVKICMCVYIHIYGTTKEKRARIGKTARGLEGRKGRGK